MRKFYLICALKLMKLFLNETYSKILTGKHLRDMYVLFGMV